MHILGPSRIDEASLTPEPSCAMTARLPIPESRDDDVQEDARAHHNHSKSPEIGAGILDPTILILMGVSGSGKSTIGAMLAQRLQMEICRRRLVSSAWQHREDASGHTIKRSRAAPWLNAIASWIDDAKLRAEPAVIASPALKRRYRDVLIGEPISHGSHLPQGKRSAHCPADRRPPRTFHAGKLAAQPVRGSRRARSG